MEVCVTLAGIKQLPRHCAKASLEADMVEKHFAVQYYMTAHLESIIYSYIVAEPLYGLGFPRRRYVAQGFNCSSTTEGLGSCSYDNFIDAQCFFGPHVAGVRCTESKSFVAIQRN